MEEAMKRAVILGVLLAASGVVAAKDPAPKQVPPPPQTQGQLNSLAAKHPTKPELMRRLAAAAQATPGKDVKDAPEGHAAESKPKNR
jgi:hypothetical protein